MRKRFAIWLAALLCVNLAACAADPGTPGTSDSAVRQTDTPVPTARHRCRMRQTAQMFRAPAPEDTQTGGANVLIACFSVPEDVDTLDTVAGAGIVVRDGQKPGNTEYVADLIQQTVGGDLFRIQTVEEYPLDHDPLVDQAAAEQADGARPELASQVEDFEKYEYVFLGFPNWWSDMPQALYTFLEEYDFGAKTIIPFVTHGDSGASRICSAAGGAFHFRSDDSEGTPVAQELASRGYQSFVVNYRLRPYTQEEGALDLARAVRFVRKNAEIYGIDENDIAVMGFSAGGILAGEMLLHYDGLVDGTALDASYVPDALDAVCADAAADGMIYSFHGRLSVGNMDVETLRAGELPPTFCCYGARDPFYDQFLANADAVEDAGVRVERLELAGRPHGFDYRADWFDD